jgi:SCF-associated factor 1
MMGLRSDGFAEANKEAHTPIKLRLPSPIRSISCGRAHALVLAASGVIYTFQCWGRPYKLSSQLLNTRHGDGAIKQIEAGWAFCAALTNAGNVIVWWPGSGPLLVAYDAARESLNQRANMGEEELRARPTEDMKEIPCHVFELGVEPVQLDDLPPDLPDLPLEEGEKRAVSTRIIKIAGADNTLIALTNGGHVLRYTNLTSEAEYQQGRWEYVSNSVFPIILPLMLPDSSRISPKWKLCTSSKPSRRPKTTRTTSRPLSL